MEYNNHILASNGNTVCFMAWSGDPDNNEPHEEAAQIIAAAPEVLSALRGLVDAWVASKDVHDMTAAITVATMAIDKAEGK